MMPFSPLTMISREPLMSVTILGSSLLIPHILAAADLSPWARIIFLLFIYFSFMTAKIVKVFLMLND